MTTQDHIRVFRERWLSIVLTVLLGIGLACAYWALQPTRYAAQIQMYVASPVPATSEGSFLSAAQLAQNRVKSYTELATSTRVLGATIARLGLGETPEELADHVSATTTDETVVIVINAEDPSPTRAAAIADAVGDSLRETVDEIERPLVSGAPVPVAVRAVQKAPVPTAQSTTSLKRLLGVGFLLGLAAGVSLALARNSLDNSIKSSEQLADLTGAPNLGMISYGSKLSKQPLVISTDPTGRQAEEFKRLRTNLQFLDAGNLHKMFVVTSALPNEGKTTTTINLAAALTFAGSRVLVIDADLRRPQASELLGVDPTVGLTSVLSRRISIDEAVQVSPSVRVDVLASGPLPPNPSELLASRQVQDLIGQLRNRYDVVLIDTSPLLPVTDAAAIAPFTDGAIITCRSQKTTRAQAQAAAGALVAVGVTLRGSILTMVDDAGHKLPGYAPRYQPDATISAFVPPSPFDESDRALMEQLTVQSPHPNRAKSNKPSPVRRPENFEGDPLSQKRQF